MKLNWRTRESLNAIHHASNSGASKAGASNAGASNAGTDPDSELVQRARQGDQAAFAELYRRHERRAYNLALRTLGNQWDAADITQEAFVKAFRHLDSFKGKARFGTWLHRIVVNTAYDHLRRQRVEPFDSDMLDELWGPAGPAVSTAAGSGGIDPAADGLSDPLRHALMSLNEGFRFAVVLCDLLGFPYEEAAEILGVREGTIKSRIFRAREALAAALAEAGYAPETLGTNGQLPCVPEAGNQAPSQGVTEETKSGEDTSC